MKENEPQVYEHVIKRAELDPNDKSVLVFWFYCGFRFFLEGIKLDEDTNLADFTNREVRISLFPDGSYQMLFHDQSSKE
jgi:hypothetical protein